MSPRTKGRAAVKRPAARNGVTKIRMNVLAPATNGDASPSAESKPAALIEAAEWRAFVGHWLEAVGCTVGEAARGDWEVALSPELQRRWRRQRVRLVFDPLRPTLPRGAWFTAPGSSAGRKILDAARAEPLVTRRTALAHVPGAPDDGFASVCKVRGLTWGPVRLGPVRYERRVAFHVVVTLWGGLPAQEAWVLLLDSEGELLEWVRGRSLPDLRSREGLYQITDAVNGETRDRWFARARAHLEALRAQSEGEWEVSLGRMREEELGRLSAFFAARIEEEEERSRRRTPNGDEADMEDGDTTSLKLDWERRAAEVRNRWALKTELRMWGVEEWAWPVADLEQVLKAGAVQVRLKGRVDVARARPALPLCPGCGAPAEMLVRARGAVACAQCA